MEVEKLKVKAVSASLFLEICLTEIAPTLSKIRIETLQNIYSDYQ